MHTPDTHLTSETQAERERLADLFLDLSPEQWDTASLCTGWRVREVVAHMTMPFRTRPLSVIAGMLLAGFSFQRYADRDARSTAPVAATRCRGRRCPQPRRHPRP